MKLVRHDNSIADLCLKAYSFLHFSLDASRGLTYPKTLMYVDQFFLGSLGDENKKHIYLKTIVKLRHY